MHCSAILTLGACGNLQPEVPVRQLEFISPEAKSAFILDTLRRGRSGPLPRIGRNRTGYIKPNPARQIPRDPAEYPERSEVNRYGRAGNR